MSDEPGANSGSVLLGVGLTAVLHGLALGCCVGVSALLRDDPAAGLFPFLFIGGLQFLWMVPASLVVAHFKWRRTLNGMGIGVAITLLLNAACFGVIAVSGLS